MNNRHLRDFLNWAQSYLWERQSLNIEEQQHFAGVCKEFYYEKTALRVEALENKLNIVDGPSTVNGVRLPSRKELFDMIDWEYLYAGIPATIHGDLQFANILVRDHFMDPKEQFVLLDWRHNFGGVMDKGDLYYDLAKMYGGLTMSYELIHKGLFSFNKKAEHDVEYRFYIHNDLWEAKEVYENFLRTYSLDLAKIKTLTALIFLNMSPLHHDPFDAMLYFLGKKMLYNVLVDNPNEWSQELVHA